MTQQMPPVQPQYYTPQQPQKLPAGLAITSMVLGIVSLAMFCLSYLSIPCAIVAVVLGAIALNKVKRGEAGGKGMAVAGLVCSIIALALDIILLIVIGSVWTAMWSSMP